jgi:hypothetical protein
MHKHKSMIFTFFTKQATLRRRSTVLRFSLLLVFLEVTKSNYNSSLQWNVNYCGCNYCRIVIS